MSIEVHLNQVGYPKIAELPEQKELPGIGEKITIDIDNHKKKNFEVTEVKREEKNNQIYIYVNSVK